jgi:gamma-glutamylcyclotransferase (GGCT)/AIG2-like uncharacterized protein YtfP
MSASTSEMVFVYGTLRRGGSNHFRMDGARFVTAATVRGRLYHIDWFPGLLLDADAGEITGETYQVPSTMMAALDHFEGDSYRRVLAEVSCDAAHEAPRAAWLWEWLGPVDEGRRIASGDWFDVQQ